MSDTEYEWRARLQPENLVIETDFSAGETRAAQSKFGATVQKLVSRDVSYAEVIKRYPAVTIMTLVGHASLAYDHGAYWESYWDELGIVRSVDFENEIRRRVVDLLDKFSLARFPDFEQEGSRKYLMMFALHAGMPVHSMAQLLAVINVRRDVPATGAALIEWLQEPGKEYRAATLDVPDQNFIENGAEFAAHIVDRVGFVSGDAMAPGELTAACGRPAQLA